MFVLIIGRRRDPRALGKFVLRQTQCLSRPAKAPANRNPIDAVILVACATVGGWHTARSLDDLRRGSLYRPQALFL